MMSDRIGIMRFTLDVGLFNRRILTTIKNICWTQSIYINIEELNGGWLSKTYGIEVKGPESKLMAFDAMVKKWLPI